MKCLHLKYISVFISVLYTVNSDSALTQLHIAFRHGERAPTDTFPNDPYVNYTWPGGWGQLTNRGKLQMYDLGQRLRSEYSNFIPKSYFHKDLNITSSYSERCRMSGQLLCAGMFPPEGALIWNEDLLWQPMPIYYVPRSQDTNIVMKAACPKYDDLFNRLRVAPHIMEIENRYKDLKDYLTEHTGMIVKNMEDVESLSTTFAIELLHNFTLPNWVNESMVATMRELAARNLAFYSETEYMKRVKGGVFLKNMIESMEKKLNKTVMPKLYLYSVHDLTLVHILRSLDLVDTLLPDFGAVLLFELYSNGEIKIKYRNVWDDIPEILVTQKCQSPCDLSTFKGSLENVLPGDLNEECELESSQ